MKKPETETSKFTQLITLNNQDRQETTAQSCVRINPALVHQLFEAQVMRSPNAIAVEFQGDRLTYQELNCRANQLAHHLQALGVNSDVPVGLCVERSLELAIALLAILKAGGAYLPLDPSYPAERLKFMLEHAQAPILITQSHLLGEVFTIGDRDLAIQGNVEQLPTHRICLDKYDLANTPHSTTNPYSAVTPDHLAYVIYTSGSTGQPKGVAMPHRPLVNLINWQIENSVVAAGGKTLQFTPISFDVSFQEILTTLATGGTLVLISDEKRRDPLELLQFLNEANIERLFLPFVALRQLAEVAQIEGVIPKYLREVITAGEQLRITSAISNLFSQLPNCTLHNHYGPSESHVVTAYTLTGSVNEWPVLPPIGRPITNSQIYLLDSKLRQVPVGERGEIYIGGVSLARGYLNRLELTAERFIPNYFGEPFEKLYKTGDLARYLPDGNIEYLGRIDQQVKIRGYRIEPAEVEAVLEQHPQVGEVVVMAREDVPDDRRLVAYVVPTSEASATESFSPTELRKFLLLRLPDYMIPSAFVLLNGLPLTPSGKVDRRALPAPSRQSVMELVAPRNSTEAILAEIWAEVLGIEDLSIHDNFLELGGHSLLATQVVSRIRDALQVGLPLRCLFELPTISELAHFLDTKECFPEISAIQPLPRDVDLPLSFVQEPLWFLDRLLPNNPFYNAPEAFRLDGVLNIAVLEQSLQEIIHRHEALRTTFATVEGKPVQVIHPSLSFKLNIVELHGSTVERETTALRLVTQEAQQPFNLSQAPLLRATLFKLSETEHIFLLNLHHIICDEWSISLLMQELAQLYKAFSLGQSSPLPALTIQYADYAVWQRQWLQGEIKESQLAYWKQQLSGHLSVLQLPTDYPRGKATTYRGSRQFLALSQPLVEKLKKLSRGEGVTLFMTMLAAFQILLLRYTNQEDVLVGSPISNRHRSEVEGVIGFFLNTLVLRTDLSGSPSFRRLLVRVREMTLGAYAHQDLPFEQLVQALQPDRELNAHPLFQVLFSLQSELMTDWDVPDIGLTRLPIDNQTAKFDLFLNLAETPTGITGYFEYSTDLFESATIARMVGHFQTLLEAIVTAPDQKILDLPLLTLAERQQLVTWNNTQKDYPQFQCIHKLIEAAVERTPEKVATVFASQQLTYRELNKKANQLAHHLQELGIKPNIPVALCVERSLDLVVGLLGILKAGGAYVPLDPAYPQERLAFMLEDAQVPIILTQQNLVTNLPEHKAHVVCLDADWDAIASHSQENPNNPVTPQDLAYIIYTSGSTGKPKGVQIAHRAVVNFLNSMRQEPGLTAQDVLVAVTTISFDIAGLELYLPLIVGAQVVLASREVAADAARLSQTIEQSGATVMQATPATWRLLLGAGWQGNKKLKILCGGEVLTRELANQLLELVDSVWNMYGPTETTIWSTVHKVEPGNKSIPVGRPIANTQVYILDQYQRRQDDLPRYVPIGIPGELHIGGDGLARGYLNRPELTAEKFIPNPNSHELDRLYKTGDLARYLPDGSIEVIGRIDHQVKIRGFRIELGEIEATITQHPAVRQAVAIVREDQPNDKRLVAYVVPSQLDEQMPDTVSDTVSTQQWQQIWNQAYKQPSAEQEVTFNISGWNDSYTGLPTPAAQMREWVDNTVEQILSLRPQRVLEIGCGTGLLLFRIAPHCSRYLGVDVSSEAINYIEQQLHKNEQDLSHVTVCQKAADALEGLEAEAFDTVIINSVIQYFPSVDYLVHVLESVAKAVKPGGCIFVGDVRSLPLLEAFHTSVQLYRSSDITKLQLQQRIKERIAQDKELIIDPAFFTTLKQHLPQINHAQIQLKRGRYHNELTRFRYDVILHVGTEVYPTPVPVWLDWQQELTLPAIRQLLEAEPEILGITRIQNARVAADIEAMKQLASSDSMELELRDLQKINQPSIDPEDLWNLSQDLPYAVHINWSDSVADGSYDVVFQRRSQESGISNGYIKPVAKCGTGILPVKNAGRMPTLHVKNAGRMPTLHTGTWKTYANNPLQVKGNSNLVPQLRAFLKDKLPDYMVPSAFVVMDTMPLTPNGKIDRRSLPAPNKQRPNLQEVFVAPLTPVEERLAQIWAAVLGIEHLGRHDNFFELGGHSLLSVQMLSQVQKTFQVELPLISLFRAPTIAKLAQVIDTEQTGCCGSSAIYAVDFNAEAVLDPAITCTSASIRSVGPYANIFLTGATGFLGAFLLHELLEQTQANVYCLVKASDTTKARMRLESTLASYSLWHPDRGSRIIPVVGDLALPFLGLSSERFQTLTETIDVIYHNGGLVNFIYPYSELKAANVLGTQEVLRLASQTKVKPVHFVSTIGVYSPVAYPDGQVMQEQEASATVGLYGYTQSKWVAEKLMAIASARGIPTSIYRPTWIEGHSQTGVCNRPGFLRSLIKGCIQLGIAPDWNMPVDIVPVNYTSQAIAHLSKQESYGKVFHVSNPQSISWNQLVRWMQIFGYPLQQVPYQQWISQVMTIVQNNPDNALYPFLTFLLEKIPQQQMSVPEIYFLHNKSQKFDSQNTLSGLVGTDISCPPVDDELLMTYFLYFIQTGFLEPPKTNDR